MKTMMVVLMMTFGGWEIVSAVILFGASLYGFLSAELAEEIVVAELADVAVGEAEEIIEESAAAAVAGGGIH